MIKLSSGCLSETQGYLTKQSPNILNGAYKNKQTNKHKKYTASGGAISGTREKASTTVWKILP